MLLFNGGVLPYPFPRELNMDSSRQKYPLKHGEGFPQKSSSVDKWFLQESFLLMSLENFQIRLVFPERLHSSPLLLNHHEKFHHSSWSSAIAVLALIINRRTKSHLWHKFGAARISMYCWSSCLVRSLEFISDPKLRPNLSLFAAVFLSTHNLP